MIGRGRGYRRKAVLPMTEIPLTEVSHACECEDDHDIPCSMRASSPQHPSREHLRGVVRHPVRTLPDPSSRRMTLPLLAQMRKQYGDGVEVSYPERGPEAWRLKLTRVEVASARSASPGPAESGAPGTGSA